MNRLCTLSIVALTAGCVSHHGRVEVRPVESTASVEPNDALNKGTMLFRRGEYILAIDAFRRAVRAAPEDASAYNGLGISYAAIGRHDLAERYLELALARAPNDGRVLRNLARSVASQGRVIEARLLEGSIDGNAGNVRPTLAQLSARLSKLPAPIAANLDETGPKLQRISLGEVLLRTTQHDRDRFGQRGKETVVSAMTDGTQAMPMASDNLAASNGVAPPPEPDRRKTVYGPKAVLAASANTLWPEPGRNAIPACGAKRDRALGEGSAPFCQTRARMAAARPLVRVVTTADQMLIYTGTYKTVRTGRRRMVNVPVIINVSLSAGERSNSEQETDDSPDLSNAAQHVARVEGTMPAAIGRAG